MPNQLTTNALIKYSTQNFQLKTQHPMHPKLSYYSHIINFPLSQIPFSLINAY